MQPNYVNLFSSDGSPWNTGSAIIFTDYLYGAYRLPLGTFRGYLERLPLSITAESGDSLQIEATCFICEDWPGPPVIGWKGCLERIRFAIDPALNRFISAL